MATSPAEEVDGPLDVQIRVLSWLVLLEGIAMVLFVALDVVSALRASDAEWGAVWFVLVVMGTWSGGLVLVSRGVVSGRRWAFTPVLLTQLLFGAAAVSFFGAAQTAARVVWGIVLVYVIVVLRLLFSRAVREHLVYANT
ncbi:MAG: hypothetical protein ACJ72Y_06795 [Actinomycetes bacterium]